MLPDESVESVVRQKKKIKEKNVKNLLLFQSLKVDNILFQT